MADNKQLLSDFVATAYKDGDVNSAISKFPELKDYDKGLLSDFVATAYKDGDVNSAMTKFPEFHKNSFDFNQFLPTKEERQQNSKAFTPSAENGYNFDFAQLPFGSAQLPQANSAQLPQANNPLPKEQASEVIYGSLPGEVKFKTGATQLNTLSMDMAVAKKFGKYKDSGVKSVNVPENTIEKDIKPTNIQTITSDNEEKSENGFEKSVIGDYVQKFDAGLAGVFGSTFDILDKGAKNIGILVGDNRGRNERLFGIIADHFYKERDKQSENGNRYGYVTEENGAQRRKDFTDLFKEGNYLGSANELMLGAVESSPYSLAAIGATVAGHPEAGLTFIGAASANEKYNQLSKENPEMSETAKVFNAVLNGSIEAGSEMIGSIPMGKVLKQAYKIGGNSFYKKMVGETIEGTMKSLSKEMGYSGLIKAGLGEGIEEGVSGVGQNFTDMLTGAKDWSVEGVFDGVGKQMMYGLAGGMQGGSVALPGIIMNSKTRKGLKVAEKYYKDAQANLGNEFDGNSNIVSPKIFDLSTQDIEKWYKETIETSTLSESQKKSIFNYLGAGIMAKGLIADIQGNVVDAQINNIKFEAATQNAKIFVAAITHAESGNVIEARLRGVEQPINITKGNIVQKEDGSIDTENSDKAFYFKTPDGRLHVGDINDIEGNPSVVPAQEAIDKSIQPVREQMENESAPEYEIGNTVVISDNTDPQNPTNAVVKITGRNEDDTYQVQRDLGNGQVQPGIVQPREILPQFEGVLDSENAAVDYIDPESGETKTGILELDTPDKQMMFANGYATIDGRQIGFENVISASTSSATDNLNTDETNGLQATEAIDTQGELGQGGDGTSTSSVTDTSTGSVTSNQQEIIPQDEKGNLLFEQARPELTIQFLSDNFEKEEIIPTVEARINSINKEISKQETFKPSGNIQKDALAKQAKRQALNALNEQLAYWKDIQEKVTPVDQSAVSSQQSAVKSLTPEGEQESASEVSPRQKEMQADTDGTGVAVETATAGATSPEINETKLKDYFDTVDETVHPEGDKFAGKKDYLAKKGNFVLNIHPSKIGYQMFLGEPGIGIDNVPTTGQIESWFPTTEEEFSADIDSAIGLIEKYSSDNLGETLDNKIKAQRDTEELDDYIAEQEHNTNPTEKQKETGIYAKARVSLQGHNITIETLKGTERSGIDEGGQKWSVTMQNHYGELDGTIGYDGDPIDVFVGPNPKEGGIYVIDQVTPANPSASLVPLERGQSGQETSKFDESKVMLGFDSAEEAKAAYLSNYEEGWSGFGAITPAGEKFKAWLYDGKKQRKPFSEYVDTPEAVSSEQLAVNSTSTGSVNSEESAAFQIKPNEIGFYSTVENALGNINQEKGTKAQFKAMLLKNGAKQAEMDWMGFDELPEKLTKLDIQKWIDENRIEVKEFIKGGGNYDEFISFNEAKKAFDKKMDLYGIDDLGNEIKIDSEKNFQNAVNFYFKNHKGELQPTKFSQYVLPGGENYKELLLTLPFKSNKPTFEAWKDHLEFLGYPENEITVEKYQKETDWYDKRGTYNQDEVFSSSHYDEPNILAHIRFDERDVNGEKVLFIEEFQSDWAQKGKKEGFYTEELEKKRIDNQNEWKKIENELSSLQLKYRQTNGNITPAERKRFDELIELDNNFALENERLGTQNVPDMPFKKTDQWVNLAARRMMRYAAENGFDRIAWTNGEQQADRYDLSKKIEKVEYWKVEREDLKDPRYGVYVYGKQGSKLYSANKSLATTSELEDIIGKELTQKIVDNATTDVNEFTGLDLKVGGQGMKAFYDGIVPSVMSKLGKPFGAKVEDVDFGNFEEWYNKHRSKNDPTYEEYNLLSDKEKQEYINAYRDDLQANNKPSIQQSIPITEKMKESVIEGIPLFQLKPELFDSAKTAEEKYAAGKELVDSLDVLNGRDTLVAKDNKDFAAMLPEKYEQFIMTKNIGGVFFKGGVIINVEKQDTTDSIIAAYEHEYAHKSTREIHSLDELANLWNKASESDKKLLRSAYENEVNWVKGDELLSLAVEDIIEKQGYENYKNGNIDLSSYSEFLQQPLKQTIDHANAEYLRNIQRRNTGGSALSSDTAGERTGDLQQPGSEGNNRNIGRSENGDFERIAASIRETEPGRSEGVLQSLITPKSPEGDLKKFPATIDVDGVERSTTNSNGQPIHSTEEGIRNFYKWFGTSKVVDGEGRPLVVYHGSISDFNEFKLIDSEIFGSKFGHFFTADKEVAQTFSDKSDNGVLYETYLKLENPQKINGFFFNSYGKFKGADAKLRKLSPKEYKGIANDVELPDFKKFREQLQSEGKDGVVLNNMSVTGEKTRIINTPQYVVFEPTHIKSAIGNTGEFNADNADIRFQILGEKGAAALDLRDIVEQKKEPKAMILGKKGTEGLDISAGSMTMGSVTEAKTKENIVKSVIDKYINSGKITELYTPLTEKEFFKKFKSQHKNLTTTGNKSVMDDIIKNGFNQGRNVNSLPIWKGSEKQNDIISSHYGQKKGDQIYLLPKEATKETPNGLITIQGYKPNREDIVNIDYDRQPVYEAYLNNFKNAEIVEEIYKYSKLNGENIKFTSKLDAEMLDASTGSATDLAGSVTEVNTRLDNLRVAKEMEAGRYNPFKDISILPIEKDYDLSKDTENDFEYDLIHALGRKLGSGSFDYQRKGDVIIRVKNHTPNWDNFNEDIQENGVKAILNITVGDYNNTDYRRNKTSKEKFEEENPDINIIDIEIPDGESLSSAIETIKMYIDREAYHSKGKTPQEIRLATGWEKGVDGLWRYEVADGELAYGYYDLIQKGGMKRLSDVFENTEIFKAYPELNNIAVITDNLGDISGSYSNKVITLNRDKFGKIDMLSVLIHEIQHAIQDIEGFAKGGNTAMAESKLKETKSEKEEREAIQEISSFSKFIGNSDFNSSEFKNIINNLSKGAKIYLNNFKKNSLGLSLKQYSDVLWNDFNAQKSEKRKPFAYEYYKSLAGEVEARNASARMNMSEDERRNTLLAETADVAPEDQIVIMDGLGVSESRANTSATSTSSVTTAAKYKGSRTTPEFYAQVKSLDELAGIGKPVHDKKGGELISDYYKRVKAWSVANNPQAWGEQDRQEVTDFIAGITPESYEAKAQKAQEAAQAAGATVVDEPKPVFQQDGHTTEDTPAFARRVVAWREQRFINGIVRAEREAEAIEAAERGETPIDHEIARMELDMQLRTVYDSLGNLIGKQRAKKLERWAGNKEMWADNLLPVKTFLDFMRSKGMKIPDIDDYYMQATALQGKNDTGFNDYVRRYQKPVNKWIHDTIKKTGFNYRDIENYVFLKHGVERNEFFKKDGKHQKADYAGVYAIAAEQYAKDNGIPFDPKEKNEIGKVLKEYANANGITLKETSESGIYDELFANKKDVIDQAAVEKNRAYFDKIVNDYISNFESESNDKGRSIDDFWEKMNAANDFSLDTMADGGIITRTQADEIKSRYKYFIPLRGHEVEAEKTYEYSPDAGVFFSNPAIKAHGRITRAENPFSYVAQMAQSAVVMKNKNDLNKTLLRLARRDKTGMFSVNKTWYIKTGSDAEGNDIWEAAELEAKPSDELNRAEWEAWNERMKELEKEGRAKQFSKGVDLDGLFIKKKQKKQHAITIIENGEEYQVYINANPRISRAINGLNRSEQDRVLQFLSSIKGMIGMNVTSRNPAFMAANFARDTIFASSILPAKEGGVYAAKYISNIGVAAKELVQYQINPDTAPQYVREFFENGGETGYSHLWELQDMQKEIDKAVEPGMTVGKAWAAITMPIDVVNKIVENTTRVAVYKTSRESGRTVERSISDAKEVSLNFNRKGAGGGITDYVRSAYLFVNAAIQALNNFTKVYKEHPVKMTGVVMGYAMSGLLMPLINSIAGDDDEYWNLPDYERQNNLCIWTGNGYVKIPLPQELRVFYRMGDNIASYLWNKKPMGKAMLDTGAGLLDLIPANPSGAASVSSVELVPDAFKPFAQVYWSNKSFTGAAIAKDPAFMKEGVPQWRQVRTNRANEPKAPAGIIWLSAELNAALGGDQYRSAGKFEKDVLNPDKLNHLARGYFGGIYTTATQGLGTITDRFYMNEKDLNEKTTGSNLQSAYNKIDEAEQRVNQFNTIVKDLKENKIDRVGFAKDTVGTNFGAAKKIQKLGSRLRDINKTMKDNQDLPEEEKKQLQEAQKTILKLIEETPLRQAQ